MLFIDGITMFLGCKPYVFQSSITPFVRLKGFVFHLVLIIFAR